MLKSLFEAACPQPDNCSFVSFDDAACPQSEASRLKTDESFGVLQLLEWGGILPQLEPNFESNASACAALLCEKAASTSSPSDQLSH